MAPRDFVRNIRAELSPPLLCCFLVNVVRNLLDNTIVLSKSHALNISLLVWSVSSHCVGTFHKYHLMSVVFGFGMPLLSFDASARSFGRCRLKVEFFHFRNQNVVNNFFYFFCKNFYFLIRVQFPYLLMADQRVQFLLARCSIFRT